MVSGNPLHRFGTGENVARARADLPAAEAAGDAERCALLEDLVGCGGELLLYRPERDHYCVLLGDLPGARHVALMVPGVGNHVTLRRDWLPSAANLFGATRRTAVVLWKGYDNPPDLFAAAESSAFFAAELARAPQELADFVAALPLRLDQTLTVVAHSFGSTVTGAALADCGMRCTDVVVAGSPGMTVDGLAQLHIDSSHFFAEAAPGDAVAGLGVFGSSPSSPTFGGTRMRTNLDGYAQVRGHSSYFMPGSQALQNIADVVTGRGRRVQIHQTTVPEAVGGSVAWVIRVPTIPLGVIGRRYRGPGFRLLIDSRRLVDVTATQTGNAVREILEVCERATDHAVALAAMVMRTSGDTGIDAHDEGGEPA